MLFLLQNRINHVTDNMYWKFYHLNMWYVQRHGVEAYDFDRCQKKVVSDLSFLSIAMASNEVDVTVREKKYSGIGQLILIG